MAARLLGLRVRIPPGAWKFVSCDCCVLSGSGLCVETITRPDETTECGVYNECDREAPLGEAMTRNRVEAPKGGENPAFWDCTLNKEHF